MCKKDWPCGLYKNLKFKFNGFSFFFYLENKACCFVSKIKVTYIKYSQMRSKHDLIRSSKSTNKQQIIIQVKQCIMGLFWIWDCLIRNSIAHLGNVADLGKSLYYNEKMLLAWKVNP